MLNPSDAGKKKPSDPTIDTVVQFTERWGYDGCIVVNLYPFISPDTKRMWQWRQDQLNKDGLDWSAGGDMQKNLVQIEEAGRSAYLRVAAFGAAKIPAEDTNWAKKCITLFEQPFCPPDETGDRIEKCKCLRLTKHDFPAHPYPRLQRERHLVDAKPVFWRPRPPKLSP